MGWFFFLTECSVMLSCAQLWFLRAEEKRAECFHSFHPVVSELTVLPQQAVKWKGMQWTGLRLLRTTTT